MIRRWAGHFGLLVLAVFLGVVLYWGLYVFAFRTPYDPVGMRITRFIPDPPRLYVCEFLNWRHGEIPPPFGCERHWKYAIPRNLPESETMTPPAAPKQQGT
ncbi:hypothetical protein [Segnochrobactrum spirostomi]|uniref:Uncharacterized protein n=1 Tax=Segnochrobactrum spirostomi TaxID=2608987 RepID=A0A6A7Y5R1_9HYPH|nr:hypothetical protein [Segnochrobactrum spirostomi]MQT14544.1 hypothetical protein [Segnochrobactrum spirostomi]